jgi:hypothetical protein
MPRDFVWDAGRQAFVEGSPATDRFIRQVVVVNAALRSRAPIL